MYLSLIQITVLITNITDSASRIENNGKIGFADIYDNMVRPFTNGTALDMKGGKRGKIITRSQAIDDVPELKAFRPIALTSAHNLWLQTNYPHAFFLKCFDDVCLRCGY